MALSDFSHTARNFLAGLRAIAVMPSEPSIPEMYCYDLSSLLYITILCPEG
jgi:hypothetical protein